jgi:hypothetical protein
MTLSVVLGRQAVATRSELVADRAERFQKRLRMLG